MGANPEYVFPTPTTGVAPPERVEFPSTLAPNAQAAGAASIEEANRPRATVSEAMGAAARQWSTANLLRAATGPSFAPEEYDKTAQLSLVDFALDENERDLLMQSKSRAEFWYRTNELKERRNDLRIMGDSPIASLLTSVFDPVWLGLSGGAIGAARVASMAPRLTAAAVEAGGAVAIGAAEQSVAPVPWQDVLVNAMIGGAASQLGLTAALRTADDFPTAGLMKAANDVRANTPTTGNVTRFEQLFNPDGSPVLNMNGKPVWKATKTASPFEVSPLRAKQVEGVLDEVPHMASGQAARTSATSVMRTMAKAADQEVVDVAEYLMSKGGPALDEVEVRVMPASEYIPFSESKRVGGSVGFYDPETGNVYVKEGADLATVNHEVSHALTAKKLRYGKQNPQSAHGALRRELEDLRLRVVHANKSLKMVDDDSMAAYYLTNVEEFVAGLYSHDKAFLDALNMMPSPNKPEVSMLRRLFDTVRRILGFSVDESSALARSLDLSDRLIDLPDVQWNARWAEWEPLAQKQAKGVADSMAKKIGLKLGWNLHKTMAGWDKGVADTLVSNPLDPSTAGNSVAGIQRAIRADLAGAQYQFEDLYRAELTARGAGTFQRLNTKRSTPIQQQLDRDVRDELIRRQQATTMGVNRQSNASPAVQAIADAWDRAMQTGLDEMKRAGVKGAEEIQHQAGYYSRRWNPAALSEAFASLQRNGLSEAQAKAKVVTMVAGAVRRANPNWKADPRDVALAIVDRTIRKGNREDTAWRAHVGNEAAAEVRDILEGAGVPKDRVQRALDVLTGVVDEAGKQPFLKSRIDLDLSAAMVLPDGSVIRVVDLFDSDLTRLGERYLDKVAAISAFARKDLHGPSEVGELRKALVQGAPDGMKDDAARMFDDTVSFLMGEPSGENLPTMMRIMAAATQMVGLGSSGIWQVTEYATQAHRYGLGKVFKYATRTLPMFRRTVDEAGTNTALATQLSNVLTRNASQDIRLRPYLNRLEDNFNIPEDSVVLPALQQAKQWVPYLNGMKYVHHHQARIVANIITDEFVNAVRGDPKARELFQRYGVKSQVLDQMQRHLPSSGTDVAQWPDELWDTLRGPLTTMMDESALRSRVGEVPAFAQFSQVGKFIFTFRSFVLTAHNKLLSGTLANHHMAGLSLMLAYQMPLAMLAVLADNTVKGKEPLAFDDLVGKALGQSGGIGLFSELVGVAFGEKQQFGAPGLIALDRVYRVGSSALSGDVGNTGAALLNAIPILPVVPAIKALGEAMKE